MKFVSQIGLAVLAVVGIVAGVTFVSQYQSTPPDSPTPATASAAAQDKSASPRAGFEISPDNGVVKWDPPSAGDFENESSGSFDYRFENKQSRPVAVGLVSKSCKCSDLTICVLPPEELKNHERWSLSSAAASVAAMSQGAFGVLAQWRFNEDVPVTSDWAGVRPNWQPLQQEDEKGVTVEPGHGGLLHVTWKGQKANIGRLAIGLWIREQQPTSSPRDFPVLELPLNNVPALRVSEPQLQFDDLGYKDQKSVDFVCWSSTRAGLNVTAHEATHHPCFSCETIPLTDEEREAVAKFSKTRVLAGYRVHITAHERTKDMEMDLGPFTRKIIIKGDEDLTEIPVVVTGNVRGEFLIGSDEEGGKIALQSFPARHGKTKTVRLTALQPGVGLEFVRVDPPSLSYLKVKSLQKLPAASGDSGQWELTVEVPPGSPAGPLPPGTSLIFKIPGKTIKHMRIPVTGISYQ